MKRFVLPFLLYPSLALAQSASVLGSNPTANAFVIWTSIAGSVGFIALLVSRRKRKQQNQLRQLEARYKSALQGTDTVRAYELGFFYYCTLRRDGKPTAEDQRTLLRELGTMNTCRSVY